MDKGLIKDNTSLKKGAYVSNNYDFVLDKTIFSKIFDKDIRRVFIYKKAERIAKALQLVSPAFRTSRLLKEKIEHIAIALIEASTLPPEEARAPLSRELLSLQGVLGLSKSSGNLSSMNADIIMREALNLLQEVASYETPAVSFGESPSLVTLSRVVGRNFKVEQMHENQSIVPSEKIHNEYKGHIKDKNIKDNRKDEIIAILKSKSPVFIKDISTMIKGVSEKTVQRELNLLVSSGRVLKSGKRRWTRYELVTNEDQNRD